MKGLSCAICILGSKNDRLNGIRHNPDIAHEIEKLEVETGFGFWGKNNGVLNAKKTLEL